MIKCFALLLGFVVLSGCTSSQIQSNKTFRVMTYNIHHGAGIDGKVDLERIAALIKSEKADLVALQEVDRGVTRTAKRDLPEELAKLTGMTAYFSKNITYDGGDYGNAVLTRFPIKSKKNTHYKMIRVGEQRGVIQLMLNVHGKKLLFMTTHIDYRPDDTERLLNIGEIKAICEKNKHLPIILCGDFNDHPGSRTYETMKYFLGDTWELTGHGDGFTFRSDDPTARIDYLWISKDLVNPLNAWVPVSQASDHLPLVGEFELK